MKTIFSCLSHSLSISKLGLFLLTTALSSYGAAHAQSVAPDAPSSSESGGPLGGQQTPGVRPAQSQALPAEALPGGRFGPPNTPQAIRWTEDWSTPPASDASILDRIRHIPLGADDTYLSLGGEARFYYTNWHHSVIGQRPNDSEDPTQSRLRLLADLHISPYLRGFLELGDNREFGAPFVTGPNRDTVDIMQAFVDVTAPLGNYGKITVRPGRFEMPLGNGKLVGVREGLDIRYSYEGVRATYILPGYVSVDGFVLRPVNIKPGSFDDDANPATSFTGVYISSPKGILGFGTDAYWYEVDRATATLREGVGADARNNWGARLWKRTPTWDFDLEANYQSGTFINQNISAWGILFEGGYTFADVTFAPRLGAKVNAFSGDGNLKDNTAGTFVAAFPRLPLFSEAAFFSYSNIVDFFPSLTLKPMDNVTVMIGPDFLWRESLADGVYVGPAGASLPPGYGRYTGTDLNLEVSWQATKNLQLRLFETYFLASNSTYQVGGRNSNYFGVFSDFRF